MLRERAPLFRPLLVATALLFCVPVTLAPPKQSLVALADEQYRDFKFELAAMTIELAIASGDDTPDLRWRANAYRIVGRALGAGPLLGEARDVTVADVLVAELYDRALGRAHRWVFHGAQCGTRPFVVRHAEQRQQLDRHAICDWPFHGWRSRLPFRDTIPE